MQETAEAAFLYCWGRFHRQSAPRMAEGQLHRRERHALLLLVYRSGRGVWAGGHTWAQSMALPPVSCEAWPRQVTEPCSLSFFICQMVIPPSFLVVELTRNLTHISSNMGPDT
jgi:hypothetical protein